MGFSFLQGVQGEGKDHMKQEWELQFGAKEALKRVLYM
jgi:hypothetical protein